MCRDQSGRYTLVVSEQFESSGHFVGVVPLGFCCAELCVVLIAVLIYLLIVVNEKKYKVNLIGLPLVHIDIIFGMDWLSANRILIDCANRRLIFPLVEEELLISAGQAESLLRDGAEVDYHPCKANVVVDALSRKSIHMSSMMVRELELVEEFRDLNLCVELAQDHISCGMITITSELMDEIREAQELDPFLVNQVERIGRALRVEVDGVLMLKKFYSFLVIVDKLTKVAHFTLINIRYSLERLIEMYIIGVVRLYEFSY
uniref:Uncharacterized protein n=1 Tax=Cajanus cajan TaxID=3821 RepID=A0A151SJR0_CAJCA|nr:hypothetical protein KK1_001182 [Cajanus cajan]